MRVFLPADRPVPRTVADSAALLRAVTALSLLGLGLIHLIDLPGTMSRSGLDGAAYLGLIGSTVVVATALLLVDSWRLVVLAGVVGVGTFVVYALSRTVGIPGDSVDIGNWSEPLGMASNFVEGIIAVYAAASIVVSRVRRGPLPSPHPSLTVSGEIAYQRAQAAGFPAR